MIPAVTSIALNHGNIERILADTCINLIHQQHRFWKFNKKSNRFSKHSKELMSGRCLHSLLPFSKLIRDGLHHLEFNQGNRDFLCFFCEQMYFFDAWTFRGILETYKTGKLSYISQDVHTGPMIPFVTLIACYLA